MNNPLRLNYMMTKTPLFCIRLASCIIKRIKFFSHRKAQHNAKTSRFRRHETETLDYDIQSRFVLILSTDAKWSLQAQSLRRRRRHSPPDVRGSPHQRQDHRRTRKGRTRKIATSAIYSTGKPLNISVTKWLDYFSIFVH